MRLGVHLILATVGCAGMYVCMVGLPFYQADFEISRGSAALPYGLVMVGFGIGGIVIGRLVDRYGVAAPLAVASLLLGGLFWLASRANSFDLFVLAHLGIGAFGCAAVFSPLLADISRWFERRRGFAIAVCASGNYLAGTLWPPLIDAWLVSDGWRTTYVLFGVLSVAIMCPLLLLVRRRPPLPADDAPVGGSAGSADLLGLSVAQLTALLCVAGVGCCMAMAMPQVHVVALSMERGFDATQGARMLSVMFGCGVISRLGFGWLSDHIGGLRTLLVGSTLQCVALLLFMPANTLWSLYLVAALFGLFQGGIVPCYAMIVREYFPAAQAGSRTGIIIFATVIGMAVGGWASGAIYDMTGAYQAALVHGVSWNLLNMLIIGFLVWRASPRSGVSRLAGA